MVPLSRLCQPDVVLVVLLWAAQAHCDSVNLDALDDKDHAHTPYVVLLVKALGAWRTTHGGNLPRNFKEKTEFKGTVAALRRADLKAELNVDEALANVYRAYAGLEVTFSSFLRPILLRLPLPHPTLPQNKNNEYHARAGGGGLVCHSGHCTRSGAAGGWGVGLCLPLRRAGRLRGQRGRRAAPPTRGRTPT